MEYKLDFSNVDRVEDGIRVKFDQVITVPVHTDGKDTGIAIYLGVTNVAAWAGRLNGDTAVAASQILDVAGRLALVEENA